MTIKELKDELSRYPEEWEVEYSDTELGPMPVLRITENRNGVILS